MLQIVAYVLELVEVVGKCCWSRVVEVGDQWEASQNIEMARFQPILQIVAHVLELVEGEGSAVRPSALPHPFVDHSKSLHRAKHCVAKVV
jgi:hypothetical protein